MLSRPPSTPASLGNRTSVRWHQGVVLKELQAFADVRTERIALAEEGGLHALAQGPGVIPLLGGGMEPVAESRPLQLEPPMDLSLPDPPETEWRYLATQEIKGQSLKELATTLHKDTTRPNTQLLTPLLCSSAFAILSRLHGASGPYQLIHRDLTPGNFIVDANQQLWLTDFELAHQPIRGELADNQILQGTRAFLAPELRSGWQPSTASDIFQVSLTLLQLDSVVVYQELQRGEQAAALTAAQDHLKSHSSSTWAPALLQALGPADARPSAQELTALFSSLPTR